MLALVVNPGERHSRADAVEKPVRILAIGDRNPDYLTHRQVDAAIALFPDDVRCEWCPTDAPPAHDLSGVAGVWLLPGSPYRDDDAVYAAIGACLDSDMPFLGTCGGFQYACVELARRAGVHAAAHAETAPDAPDLVIVALECSLYGEQRTVVPVPGSRLAQICGDAPFDGAHYCGFGLDPGYAERLVANGVLLSAHAPDAGVEAIEWPDHPFFVATAFQPQVGCSATGVLPPLLLHLIDAARGHARAGRIRRAR